jgi:hypothetical protein
MKEFHNLPPSPGLEDWLYIIENYTRRQLTVPTDKLYAMSGLARAFLCQDHVFGEYRAGIWLGVAHHCLLWLSANGNMQDPLTLYHERLLGHGPHQMV